MYYAAKADVKFITYIEQVDVPSVNTYVTLEFITYCAGVVMQLMTSYKGNKSFKQTFCPDFKYERNGYSINPETVKMYRGVAVQ
jgi:hypothetical protein